MFSAILLAGGAGRRMGALTPKQYLHLLNKPIILHALEALLAFSDWKQIVIVCETTQEKLFAPYQSDRILFARPGKERQDSVFSGLLQLSIKPEFVCIHDGARPLLQKKDLLNVLQEGEKWGAAALATPLKMTIKESDPDLFVKKTLDRTKLYEVQTPQVIRYDLLLQGHLKAKDQHLILTDDISLVELIKHPSKLVEGSDTNLKITTPKDLLLAELLCQNIK